MNRPIARIRRDMGGTSPKCLGWSVPHGSTRHQPCDTPASSLRAAARSIEPDAPEASVTRGSLDVWSLAEREPRAKVQVVRAGSRCVAGMPRGAPLRSNRLDSTSAIPVALPGEQLTAIGAPNGARTWPRVAGWAMNGHEGVPNDANGAGSWPVVAGPANLRKQAATPRSPRTLARAEYPPPRTTQERSSLAVLRMRNREPPRQPLL